MRRTVLLAGYAAIWALLLTAPSRGDSTAVKGQLVIYHAGSLTAAFQSVEAAFRAEHPGIVITDKAFGSVDMARRVTTGGEAADIFATADYQNIDALLKPRFASYTIRFAQGGMVLLYSTNNRNPRARVSDMADRSVPFDPNARPPSIPNAVDDWYKILAEQGVRIAGADPGADPGGYRAVMIMQLAEKFYRKPGLYRALRANYVYPGASSTSPEPWDYRFIYESSALAQARTDPSIRFVHLPAGLNLADSDKSAFYREASVKIAGLAKTDREVLVVGTRVTWGVTVLNGSQNSTNAIAFVNFLLTPGKGGVLEKAAGPEPITPAVVTKKDYAMLPMALRPLVTAR